MTPTLARDTILSAFALAAITHFSFLEAMSFRAWRKERLASGLANSLLSQRGNSLA